MISNINYQIFKQAKYKIKLKEHKFNIDVSKSIYL